MHPGPSLHLRSHGLDQRKTYRYPGFVELDGVRYLGQSVLFVDKEQLDRLRGFLRSNAVEHVVSEATMGEFYPTE